MTAWVILLFVACSSVSSPTAPSSPSISLPAERIAVRHGETIRAGDLSVTFADVVADSRCPVTVQCIWAGDAAVRVTLQTGAQRSEVVLHTHGGDQYPKSARWGGYEIALVDLEPAPQEQRPDASTYRAYFSVRVQTPSQSSGGGVA